MSSFILESEIQTTDSTNPDVLHRLVKQAMDNGTATTVAEAETIFKGYTIGIQFDPHGTDEVGQQIMLLTTVVLAKRVFLGGVTVYGDLCVRQKTPLPLGPTLKDAVQTLGANIGERPVEAVQVLIGDVESPAHGFSVRPVASGWRGGIVASDRSPNSPGKPSLPIAAMFAASLAVNEAFLHLNGAVPAAGHRRLGLSLWRLESDADWLLDDPTEPELTYLPSSL